MSFKHTKLWHSELKLLVAALDHIATNGHDMCATEYATMTFSILMSAKRAFGLTLSYKDWLSEHIFDGGIPDLRGIHRTLNEGISVYLFFLDEKRESKINKEDIEEIIRWENREFNLGIIRRKYVLDEWGNPTGDNPETTKHRVYLLNNIDLISEEISTYLQDIRELISSIRHSREEFFNGTQCIELLSQQECEYLKSEDWTRERDVFVFDTRLRLAEHDYEPTKETYEYLLQKEISNADHMTKAWLKGTLFDYVRENQNSIDEEDVRQYFIRKNLIGILRLRIASFVWLRRPDGSYAKLFPNVAAMEVVKVIVPMVAKNVELKKLHYGILKLALDDFGLTLPPENDNAGYWKDFVNQYARRPRNEKEITDNGSITKVTGKMLGKSFKGLTDDNISRTNISQEDFEKYKDVYRKCVHIINALMKRNLAEEGFAEIWLVDPGLNQEGICFGEEERLQMQVKMLSNKELDF